VLQYFIQFRGRRSFVRGGKPVEGKIDRKDASREEKPAVEEVGRRGKLVPMNLEAEKVEPPLVVEPPPIVKAEKVEPPPVVEEAGSR
jgi:hypothetical protein